MTDSAEFSQVPAATDSHAAAKKPRAQTALPVAAKVPQKGLAVRPEVPLHLRPVLTYAEVDALGIVPERSLRRLVAIGRVKRSLLRLGRSVRFVVQDLLDELRQVQG